MVILTILDHLQEQYKDIKLLVVQGMNYFTAVNGSNEPFKHFWARKTLLKENCKLEDSLLSEDLDVLELLRGVHSGELRKELLKEENPKINKLIQVARLDPWDRKGQKISRPHRLCEE